MFSFLSEKYDALNGTTLMLFSFIHSFRYIFTFAIGAGPVTGLIIPELSSTRTRGKIMGFSFTAHWVGIHGHPTHFLLWWFFIHATFVLKCWYVLFCFICFLLLPLNSDWFLSCLTSFIQVCNFLVGLFFLDLLEKFGVAPVYATFGGVSLLAAIFAKCFIVETKGRSLEEIEMSLNPNSQAGDMWQLSDQRELQKINPHA